MLSPDCLKNQSPNNSYGKHFEPRLHGVSPPQRHGECPTLLMEDDHLVLSRDGSVWVLEMRSGGQNCFNPQFLKSINTALDIVVTSEGECALVITATGKFFSNGHDVAWLESAATRDASEAMEFLNNFYILAARLLTLSVITVAGINGHAFAGGWLIAACCDYRVMNKNKGFVCMNEIDMNLTPNDSNIEVGMFPGVDLKMTSVLQSKFSQRIIRDMYLTGKRYTAPEALVAGLVDDISDEVLNASFRLANTFASKGIERNRRTIETLKWEMVRTNVSILRARTSLL